MGLNPQALSHTSQAWLLSHVSAGACIKQRFGVFYEAGMRIAKSFHGGHKDTRKGKLRQAGDLHL
jgi:hypothetical protein